MGLCSCRNILCKERGVFRCLSSVCWEQSHRHTYGVFWPLTRRGSGRFISIQVVNHKTLIHDASCSQQRWGRNRHSPELRPEWQGGPTRRQRKTPHDRPSACNIGQYAPVLTRGLSLQLINYTKFIRITSANTARSVSNPCTLILYKIAVSEMSGTLVLVLNLLSLDTISRVYDRRAPDQTV